METKLDMPSNNFDYPDGKSRNLIKEFCLAIFIGAVGSVLLLTSICHADKIDYFFSKVTRYLYLHSDPYQKQIAFLLFSVSIISLIISTILSHTRIETRRLFFAKFRIHLNSRLAWCRQFFKP